MARYRRRGHRGGEELLDAVVARAKHHGIDPGKIRDKVVGYMPKFLHGAKERFRDYKGKLARIIAPSSSGSGGRRRRHRKGCNGGCGGGCMGNPLYNSEFMSKLKQQFKHPTGSGKRGRRKRR